MEPLKILILEDDINVSNSLFYHFEDSGFKVYPAYSVDNALELCDNYQFDAAIVDIRLPGKSGIEFIDEVYEQNKNTIFIIYTGSKEFIASEKLQKLKRISKKIFYKPVSDLNEFNLEIEIMLKSLYINKT